MYKHHLISILSPTQSWGRLMTGQVSRRLSTRRVSHNRSLLKKLVAHRAVSKHVRGKLNGRKGEAQNPRCLNSSENFPQSVMVWGFISVGFSEVYSQCGHLPGHFGAPYASFY
ncbi:hypothetical protein AMECASPLE_010176 [Ameca splendens]|uniref:Uncharacterized protein n=1 Tax=Ameca splendens TaxID=208324 RepID=A0ABV0XDH4_9TELE